MAELAKSMIELPMKEARVNVQIQPIPLKSLEKEITPRATSHTQLEIKIKQPPLDKGMSIKELVSKHMNEVKNMVEMSSEGQHESLPNILEVNIKEENLNYNENITFKSNEELEKLEREENDANELKALVVKGNE